MSRRAVIVWVICALTLAVVAVGAGIEIATWAVPAAPGVTPRGFGLFLAVVNAIVGTILTTRAPRNALGYVFMAGAVATATLFLCEQIAFAAEAWPTLLPLAPTAALLFSVIGDATVVATPLYVLALFPAGRFTALRDRGAVVAGTVCLLTAIPLFSTLAPLRSPFSRHANPIAHPELTGAGSLATAAGVIYLIALAVLFIGFAERFRRSRGIERQQLKWFAYAAGLFGLTLALVFVASLAEYAATGRFLLDAPPFALRAMVVVNIAAFLAVDAAIMIAILRYRLYDIDLLINRTVVYGATTTAIAGIFFVGILALQTLLRPITAGSDLAIAASTLISFALFQPVRRRVRELVDRRFDRSRYDAARTLDAFSDRIRDEVDLDTLRSDLLEIVRDTIQPTHASIWLRERAR